MAEAACIPPAAALVYADRFGAKTARRRLRHTSTLGWLQPFACRRNRRRPSFNETYVAQNVGGHTEPLHGDECLLLFEDGSGNLILEDNTGFLALEFCERVAWLVPFDIPRSAAAVAGRQSILGAATARPFVRLHLRHRSDGSQQATRTPTARSGRYRYSFWRRSDYRRPRLHSRQLRMAAARSGFRRQPVRLWDWNTAWPSSAASAGRSYALNVGWLQPFGHTAPANPAMGLEYGMAGSAAGAVRHHAIDLGMAAAIPDSAATTSAADVQ